MAESRSSKFWAFLSAVLIGVLTAGSAPWWWPRGARDDTPPIASGEARYGSALPAVPAIHPVLLLALRTDGVSEADVVRYWHVPSQPAQERRTGSGTLVVGQRFGDDRYLVAHSFDGRADFISMRGAWAKRAEDYVRGYLSEAELAGSPPLHTLVTKPAEYEFRDCYRPSTPPCN